MTHVSSSLTLFLKYGFPTGWLVFFGAFTIAFWFIDDISVITNMSTGTFRIILTLTYLVIAAIIYWTVMRLKRVEMDEHFLYVTNYFKTARYPFHQIEKVVKKDYWIFKSIHISLKEAATFGKKISFIASRNRFDEFLKEHPEVAKELKN